MTTTSEQALLPETFRRLGLALYGQHWADALGEALGFSSRSARFWAAGDRGIKVETAEQVIAHAHQRVERLRKMIAEAEREVERERRRLAKLYPDKVAS